MALGEAAATGAPADPRTGASRPRRSGNLSVQRAASHSPQGPTTSAWRSTPTPRSQGDLACQQKTSSTPPQAKPGWKRVEQRCRGKGGMARAGVHLPGVPTRNLVILLSVNQTAHRFCNSQAVRGKRPVWRSHPPTLPASSPGVLPTEEATNKTALKGSHPLLEPRGRSRMPPAPASAACDMRSQPALALQSHPQVRAELRTPAQHAHGQQHRSQQLLH